MRKDRQTHGQTAGKTVPPRLPLDCLDSSACICYVAHALLA